MKILVVGYACSPTGGSEPGVGWAAVCRIARKHDVWVLTDIHNREGWERGREDGLVPDNVHVRFLRDHSACSENRFIAHLQSWLNYRSFNQMVLAAAESWHAEIGFDLCHQVTIAAWRMPSPLWRLPIPFIWGPIGGAGYIPPEFRSMLSCSARMFEYARDVQTSLAIRSRTFGDCIRHTSVVFAANEETEKLLKPHRIGKPMYKLPIASISQDKRDLFQRHPSQPRLSGELKLFAGGNMEGRKGASLALRALAIVKASGIPFHYTIAGGGPEVPALRSLCHSLGLDQEVTFHPGYRGDDYIKVLQESDVYFLPSFRESTPVTLLEAYLAGCYPIVADTSAQGEIVRLCGGKAIPITSTHELISGLADAVTWCAQNRGELTGLADRAACKAAEYFSSTAYDEMISMAYDVAMTRKVSDQDS